MDPLSRLFHWFSAAILCVFAFAPLYIGGYVALLLVREPEKFDLFAVAVLGICGALSYFRLLLAYRAATGRGRKVDGGLLPPLAMMFIFVLFAAIAIAILAFGIWEGKTEAIVGGVAYLALAALGWRQRRSQAPEE